MNHIDQEAELYALGMLDDEIGDLADVLALAVAHDEHRPADQLGDEAFRVTAQHEENRDPADDQIGPGQHQPRKAAPKRVRASAMIAAIRSSAIASVSVASSRCSTGASSGAAEPWPL